MRPSAQDVSTSIQDTLASFLYCRRTWCPSLLYVVVQNADQQPHSTCTSLHSSEVHWGSLLHLVRAYVPAFPSGITPDMSSAPNILIRLPCIDTRSIHRSKSETSDRDGWQSKTSEEICLAWKHRPLDFSKGSLCFFCFVLWIYSQWNLFCTYLLCMYS